jgi:hypothetical protein
MVNDPYEAIEKYIQKPPEPQFNAQEFLANMPQLTHEEKLEAKRQFERYL